MNLQPSVTRYTASGREVTVGLREPILNRHLEELRFEISTVCDAVDPEAWHGQVRFAGHILLATASVASQSEAARLVTEAWTSHLAELFEA